MLLLVYQARDLPLVACKLGVSHLHLALLVLLRMEGGARLVAALLEALPPPTAARFLFDQVRHRTCRA